MNMQERAESITNVRGKGTHCHVNDLLGWRSWKRMDFKTLFFSKFWNESFYGIFFSVTPLPTVSVHIVILSTIMLLKDNHIFLLFLSLFFCSFLFFFVLFCSFLFFFWSPCSFWWHFFIFFLIWNILGFTWSWKVNVTLWKETTTTTTTKLIFIDIFIFQRIYES